MISVPVAFPCVYCTGSKRGTYETCNSNCNPTDCSGTDVRCASLRARADSTSNNDREPRLGYASAGLETGAVGLQGRSAIGTRGQAGEPEGRCQDVQPVCSSAGRQAVG